jgi:hypothetical protein
MRFATDLTPEVGPPYVLRVIAPSGRSQYRRLERELVSVDKLNAEFSELEIRPWLSPEAT